MNTTTTTPHRLSPGFDSPGGTNQLLRMYAMNDYDVWLGLPYSDAGFAAALEAASEIIEDRLAEGTVAELFAVLNMENTDRLIDILSETAGLLAEAGAEGWA